MRHYTATVREDTLSSSTAASGEHQCGMDNTNRRSIEGVRHLTAQPQSCSAVQYFRQSLLRRTPVMVARAPPCRYVQANIHKLNGVLAKDLQWPLVDFRKYVRRVVEWSSSGKGEWRFSRICLNRTDLPAVPDCQNIGVLQNKLDGGGLWAPSPLTGRVAGVSSLNVK